MLKSLKQRGIGLLELILAFTIIVVLLTMALNYYKTTKVSQAVAGAREQKGFFMTGLSRYADDAHDGDMSKISLQESNITTYLPDLSIDLSGGYLKLDKAGISNIVLKKAPGSTFSAFVVEGYSTNDLSSKNLDTSDCKALSMAYSPLPTGEGCVVAADNKSGTFRYTFIKQ